MISESHIVLIVSILRHMKENLVYVKRREKQQTEQQYIKTSLYTNYPTSHYFFMKYAENGRLIYAEKRCYHPPSFLVVTRGTSAPQKTCCPICKILNPNRCCSFFSAVKKILKRSLLIDLTRQQNHAELPSLARVTEKHNFLLSQPSQFSL